MTEVARQLWTELKRGPGALLALAIAVAASVVLFTNVYDWVGRWNALANELRIYANLLMPFAIAAGAWSGGRERRRRIHELVVSTARPAWHRVTIPVASLALAALIGLAIALAIPGVFLTRLDAYVGGGWPWTVAIAGLGLIAGAAMGYALGQSMRQTVVAIAAGIGAYTLAVGAASSSAGDLRYLSPSAWSNNELDRFAARGYAGQALWLIGLTLGLLLVAGNRRRWLAVLPPMIGLGLAAALLASVSGPLWQPDRTARQLVCAGQVPRVCLMRNHAWALDAVTGGTASLWQQLRWLPGLPGLVIDSEAAPGRISAGVFRLPVDLAASVDLQGRFVSDSHWRVNVLGNLLQFQCRSYGFETSDFVVEALLANDSSSLADSASLAEYQRLDALAPYELHARVLAYLAARRECSPDATKHLR
jgi:hypothetical protein